MAIELRAVGVLRIVRAMFVVAGSGPTVWSWVAFAALAVVLGFVGRGVIRLNRRERAVIDRRREEMRVVPDELVVRVPLGMRVAMMSGLFGAVAVGVFAGRLAGGETGALLGTAAVGTPVMVWLYRWRGRLVEATVARGREMAAGMDPPDRERLRIGLRTMYGREYVPDDSSWE